MQESLVREKIDWLIGQLEEEVRKLSAAHQIELSRVQDGNAIDLQNMNDQCEKRLSLVSSEFRLLISALENEVDYLKELNQAQRLMMEDSLSYIKRLEEKLNAVRSPE